VVPQAAGGRGGGVRGRRCASHLLARAHKVIIPQIFGAERSPGADRHEANLENSIWILGRRKLSTSRRKRPFQPLFLRTAELNRLCERNIFFLMGEKGTGKTAYAVYMSNSAYEGNIVTHKFIRETDYEKFLLLKQTKNLSLSAYSDIWKVIILFLLSDAIYEHVGTAEFLMRYARFRAVRDAINEYYDHAFSPEIQTALQLVEDSSLAAELVAKHMVADVKIKGGIKKQKKTTEKRFQTNLLLLQRGFQEAVASLRLGRHHILFIDGIDIRPTSIPYSEYLECVRGLANAVWSLNNDFFPGIRDTQGRLRVVMLVRPDIFNSLGLQNRNTKLRDNSVILDWRTTYRDHRQSAIFLLADRLFAVQQSEKLPAGAAWDHYFPFDAASVYSDQPSFSSFIVFLRYSLYRPRDILTILDILRELYVADSSDKVFRYQDLFSAEFRRRYGDYLLGEIRDSLSFYYDEKEFTLFLQFFSFLDGKSKFSYEQYVAAYTEFSDFLARQSAAPPEFMKSEDEFLQFLYDTNVICFIERPEEGSARGDGSPDENFIRWCFRERSPSNISPKVRTGLEYEIHYGLANALNTGRRLRRQRLVIPKATTDAGGTNDGQPDAVQHGQIKWYNKTKEFGFVQQQGLPIDIFFSRRDLPSGADTVNPGQAVTYELVKDKQGRLKATQMKWYRQR
jgi:cold shock CspA family protein